MRYSLLTISIIFSILAICSCAESTNPQLKMSLTAAKYLNPDINGSAEPVVVDVYQLKAPYNFIQANYLELNNNPAALLGTTLLDKQTTEIRPGSQQTLIQEIAPETRYLGLTAAYRNMDTANWRSVMELPANKKQYIINVNLESQGLTTHLQR